MCHMQDKEAGKASTRMADLEDTIEKLVAVAKRKGYIDQDATVESLKADAMKNREKDNHEDAVSLMAAMKKNLDAQTSAVQSTFDFSACKQVVAEPAINVLCTSTRASEVMFSAEATFATCRSASTVRQHGLVVTHAARNTLYEEAKTSAICRSLSS